MTGRELAIYILENGLENEPVFVNHKINKRIFGLRDSLEAAAEMNIGPAVVEALCKEGRIEYIQLDSKIYVVI